MYIQEIWWDHHRSFIPITCSLSSLSNCKKNAYDTFHISNKFSYRHYHALLILKASDPTFLINIYHIVIDVLYLMFAWSTMTNISWIYLLNKNKLILRMKCLILTIYTPVPKQLLHRSLLDQMCCKNTQIFLFQIIKLLHIIASAAG